jgi:FkbM family methyltransferase
MKNLLKEMLNKNGYHICNKKIYPYITDSVIYTGNGLNHADAKVIFDVGGHTGESALRFHSSFPMASIYTFEPIRKNFDRLRHNVRNVPSIRAFKYALGHENASIAFKYRQGKDFSQVISLLRNDEKNANVEEIVEKKTIDSICEKLSIGRIEIVKTDTEGYDLFVIKGASRMLMEKRIGFIISEVGLHPEDSWHTDFRQLNDYISGFNGRFLGFYEPAYLEGRLCYTNALFRMI